MLTHLLELEPTRFEFMVNGEFLRGNLKSHIIKHEINTEKTIEIHYALSIEAPQKQDTFDEDDWVSRIAAFESNFVSGLFSGALSFYRAKKLVTRQKVSPKPLKSVKLLSDRVLAGGLDQ